MLFRTIFRFKFSTIQVQSQELTPKKIYDALDKFIIGQSEAKKAVSIALRNRWRRKNLSLDYQKEVYPKNILMIGPTGSGKTEIARRLAKLTDSPFIKVEATKYTEVGYHGKDVDEIIDDIVRLTVKRFKSSLSEFSEKYKPELEDIIINQLLDVFLGHNFANEAIRQDKRLKMKNGDFDERTINLEIPGDLYDRKDFMSFQELIDFIKQAKLSSRSHKDRQIMTVKEAKELLLEIYIAKINKDVNYKAAAIKSVEEEGIVFIDEIDKIASPDTLNHYHKGISSDGVQRDLLPLIEGTIVNTKYGDVKTDHILFIASGAFHSTKPTDLMPELLGRLPIRVELKPLCESDFVKILIEPKFNLISQQIKLLENDNVQLNFDDSAIKEIAKYAYEANLTLENIGARRLHSLIEKILEDISFEAPDIEKRDILINKEFVEEKLKQSREKMNFAKYLI